MEVHEHIHTARKNGSIISEFRLRRDNVASCRGVASARFSNNGFQPVAKMKGGNKSRRLGTFVWIWVVPMALKS